MFRSVRFRLTVLYSTLLFALAGTALAITYFAVARTTDPSPVNAQPAKVYDYELNVVVDRITVAEISETDGVATVRVGGHTHRIRVEEETRYLIRTRGGTATGGGQVLKAPMPGRVVLIEVAVGQRVRKGDGLVILEAMKMENEFRAAGEGTVKEIRVQPGQAVNPGDVLMVIE